MMRLPRVLLFAVALVASPALGATTDLTGTWTLDKSASESVDAILKAQGLGMIERKVAGSMAVTQVITVEGDTVTLQIKSTHKDETQTLLVDGAQRVVAGDLGDSNVSHVWSGDALATTSDAVAKDGGATHTTITRTVVEDGQTMNQHIEMVMGDGTTHTATRVFRRK